jgi:KUP system potassium uptake protein
MITPAISVLSAVEGLEVVSPTPDSLVVPIALAILTLLFAIQRFGTGAVGSFFGPVMAVWFLVLSVAGIAQIGDNPSILRALSPSYAVQFFIDHGGTAFIALGSVVLAVTGAEWARIPMVLLATIATVIASQAVISGAFSVARQAVGLGFLPRLTIRHTSRREIGQIYVPAINWGIFIAVVALVLGFGSSTGLASAYGIAVTGTLAIDTILFFVVVRVLWKRSLWMVFAGAGLFLFVDLAFFSANVTKVLHGGWFPLMIALVVFVVLTTWQRGRELVTRNRTEEGSLLAFVEELRELDPLYRAAGTAVFLNATKETTPLAMRANVEHTTRCMTAS